MCAEPDLKASILRSSSVVPERTLQATQGGKPSTVLPSCEADEQQQQPTRQNTAKDGRVALISSAIRFSLDLKLVQWREGIGVIIPGTGNLAAIQGY